jgi:hypothetical protein
VRRFTAAIIAILMAIGLGFVPASTAQAEPAAPAVVETAEGRCGATSCYNGYRLRYATNCINDHTGTAGFPWQSVIVAWNYSPNPIKYAYSSINGCAGVGYAANRRVEVYNERRGSSAACARFASTSTPISGWNYRDTMYLYMNLDNTTCWSTSSRKTHYTSWGPGWGAGLASNAVFGSTMNTTSSGWTELATLFDRCNVAFLYGVGEVCT